jgi:predicted GNAT family N-acyltransferase
MTDEKYIFKIAENKDELTQFYALRSSVFSKNQKIPYPNSRVASDDLPNSKICIVINPDNNQVIAGVRLNFIEQNENRQITFPERTGFDLYNFLESKGLKISAHKHVELGGFVIDKNFRGGDLAGGKVSRLLISGALETAKDFGAEILFATPSYSSAAASEWFLNAKQYDFINLGSFEIKENLKDNYSEDHKTLIVVSLNDEIDLSKISEKIKRAGLSNSHNLNFANEFEKMLKQISNKNLSFYTNEIKIDYESVSSETSFYKNPLSKEAISDFKSKNFDSKISFKFPDNIQNLKDSLIKFLDKFDEYEKQLFTISYGKVGRWYDVEVYFDSSKIQDVEKTILSKKITDISVSKKSLEL